LQQSIPCFRVTAYQTQQANHYTQISLHHFFFVDALFAAPPQS
jgi:hypothetical protein